MPGNFYSEPLKDEVRRLRAELSRERALCAGLADALRDFLENPQFQIAVGGNPSMVDAMLERARAALSELEKSK